MDESEQLLQLSARLDSLAPHQIDSVDVIVDAYKGFWNHVRFRKGWATPYFTSKEIVAELYQAAEIVFRIRDLFDSQEQKITLRQVEGTAKEYLWSLTEQQIKPADKPNFVRELVHATLKDGEGYAYNLTAERVDIFFDICKAYMDSPKTLWSDLEDQRSPEEVVGVVKRYKVFSKTSFGDLTLVEYSGIDCLNAPVLACFSTIGLLSVIVGNQLVRTLKLPLIGHLQSPVFPVSATIQNEQPMWPVRFYGNKNLVVFIGGLEIPEISHGALVQATLDFAVRHKSPMLYTVEGFPKIEDTPVEEDEDELDELIIIDDRLLTKMSLREEAKTEGDTPSESEMSSRASSNKKGKTEDSIDKLASQKYGKKIHYVTTDVQLAKKLHADDHVPCVDAILPGYTGLLLAQAALSPVDITALLAPTSTSIPDFQAAIHPLKLIHKLIGSDSDLSPSVKNLYRDGAKIQNALHTTRSQKQDLRSSGQVGMYG